MSNPKNTPSKQDSDKQSYAVIGIVFFVAGVALIISESTRITGLPFVVLGFTFFILSQQKPTKPKK